MSETQFLLGGGFIALIIAPPLIAVAARLGFITRKKFSIKGVLGGWLAVSVVVTAIAIIVSVFDAQEGGSSQESKPSQQKTDSGLTLVRRDGTPTIIREVSPGLFEVSIDGTNGVRFENDPNRNGHDTGVTVGPDECAVVTHREGQVFYPVFVADPDHATFATDPISGDRGYSWLTAGEKIRYRDPGGGNGVYVILRAGDGREERQRFSANFQTVRICNPGRDSLRVFLFFNSIEYFVAEGTNEIQDGFRLNGGDGSRAKFLVTKSSGNY